MNCLALGTAQFGSNYGIANHYGQVSYAETETILRYAHANGIDMLDTAITYDECEKRLGNIGVQDWRVVSKLPAIPEGNSDIAQWAKDSVESSLQRLKVKKIYGLLLHRPQELLGRNGDKLYQTLQLLKNKGLVKKIGVSIYDPSELDKFPNHYHFDVIQAPYNVIDQRMSTSGKFSMLHDKGIEIHVRSVFLQGLLLMSQSDRPKKFMRWNKLWSNWHSWLKETKIDAVDACVRFVLSNQYIDKVIIGVDSLKHLQDIIKVSKGTLPKLPVELSSNDPDLINPYRWESI